VIAFNLLNSRGAFVGYSEVEKLANLHAIHIRAGCFCNPGACQYFVGMAVCLS
jgi:molybdenum cofactor sulfurtransferase